MSYPYFCNTTSGNLAILRELIAAGHDHGSFFGPDKETGDITCGCGKRFSRADLTGPVPVVVT